MGVFVLITNIELNFSLPSRERLEARSAEFADI